MDTSRIAQLILVALLFAAVLGQTRMGTADHDLFDVSAIVTVSHLELRMKLPALCVRLRTSVAGVIEASAQLLTCDRCGDVLPERRWS
jgi:hypothetical protein